MYVCDYMVMLNSKRLLRGCDYTGKLDQHPTTQKQMVPNDAKMTILISCISQNFFAIAWQCS
ncbi:hypothetical protein T12_5457 [Trichinella patagoniensis]|uniref:Uncharacterized protein n=1 Tax=Trichinella patagoniensis TaxID=990121 RepID=A0A0V0ZY15_9BILA|nr:hypothetical protein T12_5457 [Trichinella patagoniensis]